LGCSASYVAAFNAVVVHGSTGVRPARAVMAPYSVVRTRCDNTLLVAVRHSLATRLAAFRIGGTVASLPSPSRIV